MICKNNEKSGMITTEVAISLVLVVAVLFITLGLFSDNLKDMIANGNFQNIFNKNESRTGFNSFSKDYAASQISVQIMGEQGLEMLRRKANNTVLDLMKNPTPNKTSILYLAMAINSIVGEPHICIYMEKDSKEICPKTTPGGYAYKINLNSSSPTIAKSNIDGYPIESSIGLIANSGAGQAYNASNTINTANGASPLDTNGTYSYIQTLTTNFGTQVNDTALMKQIETFKSTIATPPKLEPKSGPTPTVAGGTTTDISKLKTSLTTLLSNLQAKASASHSDCQGSVLGIKVNVGKSSDSSCNSANEYIGNSELDGIKYWVSAETTTINSLTSKSTSADVEHVLKDLAGSLNADITTWFGFEHTTVLNVLRNDHKESPTACAVYSNGTTGLAAIINAYAPATTISVPECRPY